MCNWSIIAGQRNTCKMHPCQSGLKCNTYLASDQTIISMDSSYAFCIRYPDLVGGAVPVTPEAKFRGVMVRYW